MLGHFTIQNINIEIRTHEIKEFIIIYFIHISQVHKLILIFLPQIDIYSKCWTLIFFSNMVEGSPVQFILF